jgi:hypothetical protein
MDLWEIIRRWHDRQSISQIARALNYDRKTVRSCKCLAISLGLSLDKPLPPREEVLQMLQSMDHRVGRIPNVQAALLPYLDEIVSLINDPDLALKPKTVFEVICERHNLTGKVSYTSYKRFIHTHKLAIHPDLTTCRLEVEAGSEIQIDYAKICMLFDPFTQRRRALYAFIGTLSHSRMKYVELTYRQDQTSFVGSHVRMFEFFGGLTDRLIIDNLKSGVIKPDLYDPSLNRAYREMIEYYGGFIDCARVRHPKDKGKVERDVQTVREAVRKEIVQNSSIGLSELNRIMKQWSINVYGQKEHGTTHQKPYAVFLERERPALKALPAEPFELAVWKRATVHPDHYIQFCGKAYSIPHAYLGKTVWIRASEHILKVYFNERLIKQHAITKAYRHTDYDDFPENVRAALDTSFLHKKLLERANTIGPVFHRLIHDLLSAHAFINLRRALGLVSIAEGTGDAGLVEQAAGLIEQHGINKTPPNFRHLIAKLKAEASTPSLLPMSEATSEFLHDITDFMNN